MVNDVSILSCVIVACSIALVWLWKICSPCSYRKYKAQRRIDFLEQSRDEDDNYTGFDRLYQLSIDEFIPIMINLKNRKVYIGWVSEMNLLPKSKTVSLFLLASGYRKEDSLEFVMKNNYLNVLGSVLNNNLHDEQKTNLIQKGLVISTDEVLSVTPWIDDIYQGIVSDQVKKKKETQTRSKKKYTKKA